MSALDKKRHAAASAKLLCSGAQCAAVFSHTWISLCSKKRVNQCFCENKKVRSQLGCARLMCKQRLDLSPRKQTCSFAKATAAFSAREHTWISLRAQKAMLMRKVCCVLALISLRAQRNMLSREETATVPCRKHTLDLSRDMFTTTAAAFPRCAHAWISLRVQNDISSCS